MEFKDKKGIYLQIAENLMDRFLEDVSGEFSSNDSDEDPRIPSIRETAEDLGVNPNTVMRSYSFLQELGIIYNRRGIGFFLSADGRKKAVNWKKDEFIRVELPEVFKTMRLLDMKPDDLMVLYSEYNSKEEKNEVK
ncbi:MAG: GntR family transcriptional regulator [Spirochaetales bacterium]|nr:GntR family transcriptional regulator [Spirochaetales bacterium]